MNEDDLTTPPWGPFPPQFDGKLSFSQPENFTANLADQALWDLEVQGLLPLADEPKPKGKRGFWRTIGHALNLAMTELGKPYDQYGLIMPL